MQSFTIDDLSTIAADVIGRRRRDLRADMTAQDVPGWDSLNHTLIVVEIASQLNIELSPKELGDSADFGELIERVNRKLAGEQPR